MNFKFLPFQFTQSLNDLIKELKFTGTQDIADMYLHLKPPEKILGHEIKDVFLYFVCHNLIASLITLKCQSKYHAEIIEKLSDLIGTSPKLYGKYSYWMDDTVALYCYLEDEDKTIRLYYTIKEYDVFS